MAEGRVDGANALEFHEALEAAISPDDTGMVLDFDGISYICCDATTRWPH